MRSISLFSWLIAVFFSISVILASGQCQSDQRRLLLGPKNSFNSTSLGKLVNWNKTTDCCSWDGASCDAGGRVIRLDLSNQSASAPLPNFFAEFRNLTSLRLSSTGLTGRLPEEIPHATTLRTLDLSDNKLLKGSFQDFPLSASLQTLVLSDTNFGGQVPESIANLGQLTRIEVARCNFSGPIPESMLKLTQLVYLDFPSNNFSGPMPSFSSSRNLTQLDLAFNQLNGTIDSTKWSGLSKLVIVDLRKIKLSGTIPPTLFGIPSLQQILLSQNQFSGDVLPGLKSLILSSNNFSGFIQMTDILKLRNLFILDLSYNKLSIDGSATNSTLSSFPNITTLKLASCNLTKFPEFEVPLQNFTSFLTVIDLHGNQLQGPMPLLPQYATYLDYSNNNFSSFLLEGIGNYLSVAYFFSLSSNKFEGSIPSSICNSTYLQVLDLSNNSLHGPIPHCLSQMSLSLGVLNLRGNKLGGVFHDAFPQDCMLQTLDLNGNLLH
ncbi:hypothetical protein DITRI_Ditri12bG0185200 [Diplodiscus trichospermus]